MWSGGGSRAFWARLDSRLEKSEHDGQCLMRYAIG